jgi:hypothetical protein
MMSVRAGCCLIGVLAPSVPAAQSPVLDGGAYDVEVKLELPHLEDMAGRTIVRLCLAAAANGNNPGLAVLSDNNPLAHCPVSNLRQDGDVLTFDITCEGRNAARASARYVLARTAFRGRIAMQMGGKNMTMTEIQSGRRTGACDANAAPAP